MNEAWSHYCSDGHDKRWVDTSMFWKKINNAHNLVQNYYPLVAASHEKLFISFW